MPASLKWYIAVCGILGALLAVVPPVYAPSAFSDLELLSAMTLGVMTVLAIRFPIVLRASVELFMVAVPTTALVLTTPLPLVGLVVGIASLIGYVMLRLQDSFEIVFNVGQTIIHLCIAATVFATLKDRAWLGPDVGGIGPLGAIVATGVVLVASNYAVVSGAAALQMGANFFRVWRSHLTRDLLIEVTQIGVGVLAAILVVVEPLVVPILAVPVVLVSISSRRASQLESDTHDALSRLVELLELRDPYTAGHSRRVAGTARVLALKLGFTPEEAVVIESAGEVHDIGKIIIEPNILHKVGGLTDEEFALIRQHPVFGASITSRFASYGTGHLMVRHHHERWDGGGYPDGLEGEAIPIGARIIAVADSFDAMTSARAYRAAMPHEQAVGKLIEGAGVQWDPAVVSAMLDHLGASEPDRARSPRSAPVPATGDPSHVPSA